MNIEQLRKIAPTTSQATLADWLPHLNEAMARFGITKPEHQAAFVAQTIIESGGLTSMVENLNYRPQAIMRTFRGRFTPAQAAEYGFVPGVQKANPRMIANIAYGGRYGNGDAHTDDGWRYRGRGPIQLTFKSNYQRCGADIGIDLVNSPEMLEQPRAGALAAAWFWHKGNRTGRSLNTLAEQGRYDEISLAINPGAMHLQERIDLSKRALQAMREA